MTNDREGPDAEGTMGIDADVPQPVAPPRETIRSRSVNDFDSEEGLAMALKKKDVRQSFRQSGRDFPTFVSSPGTGAGGMARAVEEQSENGVEARLSKATREDLDPELDWVLTNYDAEMTQAQTLKEELQRLQVLKSYLILDSEREANFERLTALASRMFHVPIALVSLVDLGRQWFMSNRGLGDVRETPRRLAFCAHAILSKEDLLIVPDATKDRRFADSPLVTGPPHIRFYAGAPLLCPEGYKLGTLCLIDTKPRPDGLTLDEKQNIRELASLVVDSMVERRRQKMSVLQDKSQVIATTAHDLLTPLTGVQMSLSVLMDNEDFKKSLPSSNRELLETAIQCGNVMNRICSRAIETFRGDVEHFNKVNDNSTPKAESIVVNEMVRHLNMVMEAYPKKVPLVISVDPLVPPEFLADDLRIFRSAVNYMTNACKKTETGSVHLRITVAGKPQQPKLLFECKDTGPGVAMSVYPYLFRPFREKDTLSASHTTPTALTGDLLSSPQTEYIRVDKQGNIVADNQRISECSSSTMANAGLGLYSVATQISSIGGEYGYRPGEVSGQTRGSNFWFSIPLSVPSHIQWNMEDRISEIKKNKLTAETKTIPVKPLVSESGRKRNEPMSPDHEDEEGQTPTPSSSIGNPTRVRILGTKAMSKEEKQELGDIMNRVLSNDSNDGDKDDGVPTTSNDTKGNPEFLHRISDRFTKSLSPSLSSHSTSKGQEQVAQEQFVTTEAGRTRRALVIDDSLVIRKSVSKALSRLGFRVTQAENGLEGLKEMQNCIFDVVLCDFLMPVMDGLDCVQQFREWEAVHRPWFRQYIMGISAHASTNDVERGKSAGMDDFQSKPVTMKTLKILNESDKLRQTTAVLDRTLAFFNENVAPRSGATVVTGAVPAAFGKQSEESTGINDYSESTTSAKFVGRQPVCLIARDSSHVATKDMKEIAEGRGWQVAIVDDGEDALRLLKMRNWDAVFLDEEIARLSGARCVSRFREWEKDNRIARQDNLIYMSSQLIPTPSSTTPTWLGTNQTLRSQNHPRGFDGAIGKPVLAKDLSTLLQHAESNVKDHSSSASILSR